MLSRYPIGLAVTVLALGIAGHRLWFIARLVGSGAPDPGRWRHVGRHAWVEVREVIGQQRLLRETVPGLAHAFTFWGFMVLLFSRSSRPTAICSRRRSTIPFASGTRLFWGSSRISSPCAVLIAPRRLHHHPPYDSPGSPSILRPSRFYGSHPRCRLDRPRP